MQCRQITEEHNASCLKQAALPISKLAHNGKNPEMFHNIRDGETFQHS